MFMALSLFFCLKGWIPNPGSGRIFLATLATVTGPFTGAIARYDEPVIQGPVLRPMLYCAAYIVILLSSQVIPLPFRRVSMPVRYLAWLAGLVAWFGAGIISLLAAID